MNRLWNQGAIMELHFFIYIPSTRHAELLDLLLALIISYLYLSKYLKYVSVKLCCLFDTLGF